MKSEFIVNQATVEVPLCGETYIARSNLVRVRIRCCQPAKVCLRAKKVVCGTCLCARQFQFAVCDQSGKEVARATNDRNGNVVFPHLTFEQVGVYVYAMQEINKPRRNWILDCRCYPVIATVFDSGQGKLAVTVSYPCGSPVFVNRYCPKTCLHLK